jgi:hypothetical protein
MFRHWGLHLQGFFQITGLQAQHSIYKNLSPSVGGIKYKNSKIHKTETDKTKMF